MKIKMCLSGGFDKMSPVFSSSKRVSGVAGEDLGTTRTHVSERACVCVCVCVCEVSAARGPDGDKWMIFQDNSPPINTQTLSQITLHTLMQSKHTHTHTHT